MYERSSNSSTNINKRYERALNIAYERSTLSRNSVTRSSLNIILSVLSKSEMFFWQIPGLIRVSLFEFILINLRLTRFRGRTRFGNAITEYRRDARLIT